MVDAFRAHGVSFKAIREAASYACHVLNDPHPFTMREFSTDGNRIFAEALEGKDERVLDMNRGQYVSKTIVQQSLFKGIEFEHGQTARWFPVASRKIVIDPDRSFGRPVLARSGVPTEALFAAYEAEDSIETVANWYEVSRAEVRAAVDFEKKAAA
ncbi:DUF433 domain-containing protein [bacterium SCSIO 12827]|nr:DUF433 domain-containing protein [bacterium SCSIO 12827]